MEEQAADQLAGGEQAGQRPAGEVEDARASSFTRTPPNVNVIPHVTPKAVNGGTSIGSERVSKSGTRLSMGCLSTSALYLV